MANRETFYKPESYGESPGSALTMGTAVGICVFFFCALVLAPNLHWWRLSYCIAVGAAVAASVATLKRGSHLGRVVKLGIMALIGSPLLYWIAGCTLGLLIISGTDINLAAPTANLETIRAIRALRILSFNLSIILIFLAALVGVVYWEQDPDG